MRKKIRIFILIISICFFLFYVGLFLINVPSYIQNSNPRDFSYVKKTEEIHENDSSYFKKIVNSKLNILYTCEFRNLGYLSVYTYNKTHIFLVRKLDDKKVDLMKSLTPYITKNTTNVGIEYDVEEMHPFTYKLDIGRKPLNTKKYLLIDGKDLETLKQCTDSLLIKVKMFDLSIGQKNKVDEGLYLFNDTFFRKPVEIELLIFNRGDGLYLYAVYNIAGKKLRKGLLDEIIG